MMKKWGAPSFKGDYVRGQHLVGPTFIFCVKFLENMTNETNKTKRNTGT